MGTLISTSCLRLVPWEWIPKVDEALGSIWAQLPTSRTRCCWKDVCKSVQRRVSNRENFWAKQNLQNTSSVSSLHFFQRWSEWCFTSFFWLFFFFFHVAQGISLTIDDRLIIKDIQAAQLIHLPGTKKNESITFKKNFRYEFKIERKLARHYPRRYIIQVVFQQDLILGTEL